MAQWRLRGVSALVVAAIALAAGCGSSGARPATSSGIPSQVLAEARPIGQGARFHPPVKGPVIGPCRPRLGPRYGVHLEVFGSDRVVIVPAGIGTLPPRTLSAGRIYGARCFGALVTIDPTGLVLVRPGARLFLADLLRSWGEPLSPHRVAAFSAPTGRSIAVFVNGRRWHLAQRSALPARGDRAGGRLVRTPSRLVHLPSGHLTPRPRVA
jgi:hypothetical protein